jgi:hypothetical protein
MKITDLAKREPSLEEAFLKLIGDASTKESESARRVESEVERLRKEIVKALDKIKSE